MLHEFFGFTPWGEEQGDKDVVDGSFLQLARLDAWIVTFVMCFTMSKTQSGHRQKLFAGIQGTTVKLAKVQQIENAKLFVE